MKLANDHKVWHWSPKKIGNGRLGFFQDEVSGMNAMIKDHPSLKWAMRLYDVSIALMVGGMLGNGIDALRLGGALDWIPLGRSLMNFADVALLSGLAFFQLGTSFFIKAAMAHKAGKPLDFNTVYFLGLPLVGVFIAWAFGSAEGAGALDLAMKNVGFLYLMGFSMLVGFSRFLAATVLNRFVSRFVAEEAVRTAQPRRPKRPPSRALGAGDERGQGLDEDLGPPGRTVPAPGCRGRGRRGAFRRPTAARRAPRATGRRRRCGPGKLRTSGTTIARRSPAAAVPHARRGRARS